jgi:hypothetical protein
MFRAVTLRALDDGLRITVREIAFGLLDRRAVKLAKPLLTALRTPDAFVAVLAVAVRAIPRQ